jgi:polysaccharide export outer membrane protein
MLSRVLALLIVLPLGAAAQTGRTATPGASPVQDAPEAYVIGPGDVLSIRFWRQNEVSGDVIVRPDGKVSLLLLDDVQAAGLTPEALRDSIRSKADRFFEDPQVTVIIKEVHSRNVYITGMIAKPGPYPLRGPLTVVQLIALAGGLVDYAKKDQIVILRNEQGRQTRIAFNYERIIEMGSALNGNIQLVPGDTIVVP